MSKFIVGLILVAAAIMEFAGTANAISVTIVSQDTSDFTTLPANVSQTAPDFMTGTVIVNQTGSSANNWRSPFENAGSGSGAVQNPANGGWVISGAYSLQYITIQAGGSATYDFSSAGTLNALSMLWGSPDYYNSIAFCTGISGGVTSGCSAVLAGTNPPINIQTYGHDQISFTTDVAFIAVVLGSSINAFEYANLNAYCNNCSPTPGPVPLPPRSRSSLQALGHWVCSGGAGSGRLKQPPDQNA